MMDEFFECENAVKASPEFQAALRKRGIDDTSKVMVDPWPAGNYGVSEEEGVLLSFARSWLRTSPTDNGYRPSHRGRDRCGGPERDEGPQG